MKPLEAVNTVILLALTGIVAYGVFRAPVPVVVQAPVLVRSQPQQTPIEYIVKAIKDQEWDTEAKELGAAGWEVITCRRASDSDNNFSYECIMKRTKAD